MPCGNWVWGGGASMIGGSIVWLLTIALLVLQNRSAPEISEVGPVAA